MSEFQHPEDYLLYRGWKREDQSDVDDLPDYLYHYSGEGRGHHNIRYESALIHQLLTDIQTIGGLEELVRLVGAGEGR